MNTTTFFFLLSFILAQISGIFESILPSESKKKSTTKRIQLTAVDDDWGNPSDVAKTRTYWYASGLDATYALGLKRYGANFYEFSWHHGAYINDNYSVGLGAGLRQYMEGDSTYLPIFANLRVKFKNNLRYPFLNLKVGYSFDLKDSFAPVGFRFNPTLGLRLDQDKRIGAYFSLGWDLQQIKGLISDPLVSSGLPYESKVISSAFCIGAGLYF